MKGVSVSEEVWLQGRPVVAGVAIGSIHFLVAPVSVSYKDGISEKACPDIEIKRFLSAVEKSQKELVLLSKKLSEDGFCREADIVDMHSVLIEDVVFNREVTTSIQKYKKRADVAIFDFLQTYRTRFCHIPDAVMRQRFEDVEAVCARVLSCLSEQEHNQLQLVEKSVIFAETAAATLIGQTGIAQIQALVTTTGGAMSHTAIVAKAQGIPYVTGISVSLMNQGLHGREVIVDGLAGLVILDPKEQTRRRYISIKKTHEDFIKGSSAKPRLRARTKDGSRIFLYGNVANVQESSQVSSNGMDGVGLYRSEYLVLEKNHFPDEEEQTHTFRQIVQAASGKKVVLRVFDFGSDKRWDVVARTIPHFEEGKRTVPLLLENPSLLLSQLKAMLRSSVHGSIAILFPMVATLQELSGCLEIFEKACNILCIDKDKRPPVGVMIEVPSMAFLVNQLQGKIQFLSLGTNDLFSHTLALDRNDIASLDSHLQYHLGFLRLISWISEQSKKEKLPLCVCGEMASDPLLIPFLIGVGIKELSISPRLAPMVKHVLRSYSLEEMGDIAKNTLSFSESSCAYEYLKQQYCSVYGVIPI